MPDDSPDRLERASPGAAPPERARSGPRPSAWALGAEAARQASAGNWVFLSWACLFTLTNSGFDTSEGSLSYRQAAVVLTEGRLTMDGEPENVVYLPGPDGHRYSSKEFGSAVVQIPAAATNLLLNEALRDRVSATNLAAGQRLLAAAQAGVLMAAAARYFFMILFGRYRLSRRQAFAATALLLLTTYCWPYSRSLFDGVVATPFLIGGLYHYLRYEAGSGLRSLAVSGALLGFGVAVRVSLVLGVAAVFAALLLSRRPSGKEVARAIAVLTSALAPFAGWVMWYNHLRTGSPFVSPMQLYEAQNGMSGDLTTGLLGLTVSPGKGLFVYCPLLVLSLGSLPWYARRDRCAAVFLIVLGGLWLLVHARLRVWYGSWGWGPRHFVTIVPVLFLPLAARVPELVRTRWFYPVGGILGAWGFVLALSAILTNPHHLMAVAVAEHRIDDETFIWSPGRAQSIDAMRAVTHNFGVMRGSEPVTRVAGESDLNSYASNTVNLWAVTAIHAGAPPAAVIGLVLILLLAGGVAARRAVRAAGTDQLAEGH